ncbi:unnamed protein product [Oikopleura dioica]|uniref:Uncharacterized protein n=1 Tax=Oikopleura dioica TaxID=34765 RepID=E4XY42_OIKDI|nr:unnamed protein product [Oikopleura dioica]
MCTEESATFNLTEVATEKLTTEIDDFFANFDRETMLEEKLAKFQEPRNTITINSKECLISFDEYETCAEIRSKNTSNIIFDVVKYVVISLCSCAFGVLLVHFFKWSKSDSLRRQSNFVERQRSQVQSPSLAHSATLNSVDVRSASSPSEKDALTKHV